MNLIWFLASLFGLVFSLFTVTSSYPPTPPSKSSEKSRDTAKDIPYLKSLGLLAKNGTAWLLIFTVGKGSFINYFTQRGAGGKLFCNSRVQWIGHKCLVTRGS